MIRIAMFSGPRNISTAMMRSFESRADTHVVDEPFYACYLTATKADHPMREDIIRTQLNDWDNVIKDLRRPTNHSLPYAFEKHIAYHLLDKPLYDWFHDAKVFHLIREPRAMIASFAKKYADAAPIADSYRAQRAIDTAFGAPCPVIDAADILASPRETLNGLCDALDIPFDNAMLSWSPGARPSDGVWGAHWYDAVKRSTGFRAPEATATPASIPAALEPLAEKCRADYEYFHARRIRG